MHAWEKYVNNNEAYRDERIRSLRAKRGEEKNEPTVFKFRVYFENITKEELNRLRWSLTFDDPDCAHKIGRAKPLGLGSVRMSVKQVGSRQIDQETGEWSCRSQFLENSPKVAVLKLFSHFSYLFQFELCYNGNNQ